MQACLHPWWGGREGGTIATLYIDYCSSIKFQKVAPIINHVGICMCVSVCLSVNKSTRLYSLLFDFFQEEIIHEVDLTLSHCSSKGKYIYQQVCHAMIPFPLCFVLFRSAQK